MPKILQREMNSAIRTIAILMVTVSSFSVQAQKEVTNQNLVWYSFFSTQNIGEKWFVQSEVQERHFVNPASQHQFVLRCHLHRVLGKSGWETAAGICFFLQSPNDPESNVKLTIPELRPHIEFTYRQKLKYLSIDHRYKAEARFFHNTNDARTELEDGFGFGNFRLRYRVQVTVPILKIDDQRALKLKLSDEIHINAGQSIVKNVFDQNRIYGGLSVDVLPSLTFEAGLLNWFQQRPSGDYYNRKILRFTVYHKINLLKSKRELK